MTQQESKLESQLEKKFLDWAKDSGWMVRKMAWPGYNGAPDRLVIGNGRVIFLEFKRPGKEPTELQWSQIKEIRKHLGTAEFVDDVETARKILYGLVRVPDIGDRSNPRTRVITPFGIKSPSSIK